MSWPLTEEINKSSLSETGSELEDHPFQRALLNVGSFELGLLDLANRNIGQPAKFEFQISEESFL